MEMKTGGDAQVVLLSGSRPRIVINSSERNPEKKNVGKVRTALLKGSLCRKCRPKYLHADLPRKALCRITRIIVHFKIKYFKK